ncbi:MAG: hypothetical protein KGP35_04955 [Bacteroidetes bacterium]|nr:hypothetical protein [Bacteroidota bacterium]
MKSYIFLFLIPFFSLTSMNAHGQTDSTVPANDEFDYSLFTDAAGVKRYATQKVINQSPSRIVSIGFEYHDRFQMNQVPQDASNTIADYTIRNMSGFRAQVNLPVISNDKFIWQVGANYWGSQFTFKQVPGSKFESRLQQNGLHSLGVQSTIFKPLDEKHWLVVQVAADVNSSFSKIAEISRQTLTLSGTAIYGWKYSDRNMFGVGLARTYRAGALLHVPVIFWNKTFNDHYGMELLLPARGYVRRNFSTTSMLQLGYELEGNQFQLANAAANGSLFLQRGELKPRIMWDQKIAGFIWLNLQAGLRMNWRFDVMNKAGSREIADRFYENQLTNPFFFAISLNLVSP